MRPLPAIRTILEQSNNKFVGLNKAHGRVTVEPAWKLNMTGQTYGDGDKGPYRYWYYADQSQVELEVPNIESIVIDRSLDQDAATCTITMANQAHDDNDQTPGSLDQVGNPGFYGFGFGSAPDFADQWGHTQNSWNNILIPNALLRTYQGYGGWSEINGDLVANPLVTAIDSGNLALSGVWLIDTVSLGTSGKIQLKCRDMAKLLIEQMVYTPLIPERYYPPKWYRYTTENVPSAPVDVPQPEPRVLGPAALVYEDSSVVRWLGAASHTGSLAPLAFTADETQISAGSGWYYWDNDYAKDWWQATCSGEINEVYISPAGAPPGGGYFTYISIMENGVWQGAQTIKYDDTGNIALYHPEKPPLDTGIPYVKAMGINVTASVNIDLQDGTWVKLDRVYNAERIRITMHSTWRSPWGPNYHRSAVGNISAKLSNVDVVTELPAVVTTYETIQHEGNIRDWVDPVKELLMWAGFLYYDGANPANNVGPYGIIENSGTWPRDDLGENLFDKKSIMDAIVSIKEVLGYIFFIDETGSANLHSPNWWSPGNTTGNGLRLNYIHEISDELTLTDYTANYTDNAVRSEIVIGSNLSDDAGGSTHYASMDPTGVLPLGSPDLIRGMTRPAIWTNEVFVDPDEQKLMAALISLHIMFNARQGNVTIVANPEIQINDQVRITERVSSESFIHYVRSVSSNMDLRTGEWTMTLGTNWLGEQDQWAFDRDNLLALYNRQGVNPTTNYDNGRDAWANFQSNRTQDTRIAVDLTLPANVNHGLGGTWSIAVVAGRDPGGVGGLTPADVIDSDIVALFSQISAIGQMQVSYVWSTASPPTGYDVVVITQDTNSADIISWGSMALFSTPTIHARPASFNDSGVSGGVATAANSITISAVTNAAFTIPGFPGIINFGDGGVVTTSTHAAADLPAGSTTVGVSPSNSEVVIAAVAAGLTYPDANVSLKKHVVWGADIGDVDAYDASVWQTMINAIFWVRSV